MSLEVRLLPSPLTATKTRPRRTALSSLIEHATILGIGSQWLSQAGQDTRKQVIRVNHAGDEGTLCVFCSSGLVEAGGFKPRLVSGALSVPRFPRNVFCLLMGVFLSGEGRGDAFSG